MLPGAVIFVNNDLTSNVLEHLLRQLYIDGYDGYISGTEFDARVAADPNYPTIVHLQNLRILVIRDFWDGYNRNLADVAIFVKAGLATIEANKFGPPGQTFPVTTLTIYKLLQKYPIAGSITIPSNVQNNITAPLYTNRNQPDLYPFGSGKSLRRGGRGALVDEPEDE